MTTILVSAPYILSDWARFRPVFERAGFDLIAPEVSERLNEDALMTYAGQFDAALCGDDQYTAQVFEACSPRLKVVVKWGTGIDSLDQTAAARLGVPIRNTPNAFTVPVADTVMGYILAFARRQPWMDKMMKAGVWNKIPGRALSECTLGVIGVGNCGKAVIRRARAFGMEILANDIVPIRTDFIAEHRLEMTTLEDLLARSDYVSVNCDLNPTSYHLMNAKTFALMHASAVLINAARGPIVDEKALIQALEAGVIGGAALDVFEHEPLPDDSPLKRMDNVMLAPHNANSSPTAWEHVHKNSISMLFEGLGMEVPDLSNV